MIRTERTAGGDQRLVFDIQTQKKEEIQPCEENVCTAGEDCLSAEPLSSAYHEKMLAAGAQALRELNLQPIGIIRNFNLFERTLELAGVETVKQAVQAAVDKIIASGSGTFSTQGEWPFYKEVLTRVCDVLKSQNHQIIVTGSDNRTTITLSKENK